MQHPGGRRADALHRAQFFLAGFQHRRKIAEPVNEVVGNAVGILLGIGQIEDVFQCLMFGQTVPDAVCVLPWLLLFIVPILFFNSTILRDKRKCSGKIS